MHILIDSCDIDNEDEDSDKQKFHGYEIGICHVSADDAVVKTVIKM